MTLLDLVKTVGVEFISVARLLSHCTVDFGLASAGFNSLYIIRVIGVISVFTVLSVYTQVLVLHSLPN